MRVTKNMIEHNGVFYASFIGEFHIITKVTVMNAPNKQTQYTTKNPSLLSRRTLASYKVISVWINGVPINIHSLDTINKARNFFVTSYRNRTIGVYQFVNSCTLMRYEKGYYKSPKKFTEIRPMSAKIHILENKLIRSIGMVSIKDNEVKQ